MTGSPHITLRRTALVLVTGIMATVFAGSALAAKNPAASFYTPQQLEAMSANWAAKGRLLGSPDAVTFYTRDQLQAMSANWAAKGRLLGSPDAASFYTPQQLQAMSANWAAKGRLLGSYSPQTTPPVVTSSTFAWPEFGIGAGAMLGVVLLLGGVASATRYSRRTVRVRPAA